MSATSAIARWPGAKGPRSEYGSSDECSSGCPDHPEGLHPVRSRFSFVCRKVPRARKSDQRFDLLNKKYGRMRAALGRGERVRGACRRARTDEAQSRILGAGRIGTAWKGLVASPATVVTSSLLKRCSSRKIPTMLL